MQQAFIEEFGGALQDPYQARISGQSDPHPAFGRYPLLRPGSVRASGE
jgi:hypothetical protein